MCFVLQIVIADTKSRVAIWLSHLAPGLLERILLRRLHKQQQADATEEKYPGPDAAEAAALDAAIAASQIDAQPQSVPARQTSVNDGDNRNDDADGSERGGEEAASGLGLRQRGLGLS